MKKPSEENSGSSRRPSTEGSSHRKNYSADFEPPIRSDGSARSSGDGARSDRPARDGDRPARPTRSSYGDR
ncbi:MAG: hypothetical protein ACO3CL_00955, partial [Bacteroidia bacterium]